MSNPDDYGSPRPGLPPGGAVDGAQVDADPEWAQYVAWADREAAAGRIPEPEPWPSGEEEPWDPEPWDPQAGDADVGGPAAGPAAGGPARPLFAEDGAGDVMPPSPFLAALTEQAVGDVAALSDAELAGVLRASRRMVAREQYKQVLATAEFGRRRRAAFEGALARGVPAGCAPGGFPGEELAIELVITRAEAGHLIDDAIDLTTRLPKTLTEMAAGLVDAERAGWIAMYTRGLSPADAARADEVLAEAAADLRAEQLARKAAALEMRLNPDGVKARREHAKRDGQRVEARREASGNASLAGRELDTADVLASKAYLDAIAAKLHASGLVDGPLDRLRALALTDLTQGRDPLDRIKPGPAPTSPPGSAGPDGGPVRPGGPATLPALINLIVPAGTLLGWSAAPAQAGAWGLLDRDEIRAVAAAAAAHPQSRWCVTLTGPDGAALAHGCARGSHPRLIDQLGPQPPPRQLAELLRLLNLAFTPVARGSCDHVNAEGGYVPSRKLRHVIRARNATCDAPGCHSTAMNADLDHTVPWPAGPTDQCNLAPRCRTHHRAKQAPDWKAEQIAPGVTRWTLPSGRTHVTAPTRYDT
jgi:predicted CxxxxCH...CXXCH cytochrome family protein